MSLHFLREIEKLKRQLLNLGGQVEGGLKRAVQSVSARDGLLAQQVIAADLELDRAEVDLEEEGLKILALYHPVASDLRFVISALKINNDLERIGDLSVNIAERSLVLCQHEFGDPVVDFSRMSDLVLGMVKESLDALVEEDSRRAWRVLRTDDQVDALNRQGYQLVKEAIARLPARVHYYLQFLSISNHLERAADHATNIAEDVIYFRQGEIVRHRVTKFAGETLRQDREGLTAALQTT